MCDEIKYHWIGQNLNLKMKNKNAKLKISFAVFAPHPPIILPDVGSAKDRKKVEKTIASLNFLGEKLKKINPDLIIISSPHPDWGIKVPLHFLTSKIKAQNAKSQFKIQNCQSAENILMNRPEEKIVYPVLTAFGSPRQHYQWGEIFYESGLHKLINQKIALIGSGDLSHCLKKDGPYGFHPDGPKFDNDLINFLKTKNIEEIFYLNDKYPQASECGLRSFCFILGILDAYSDQFGKGWHTKILSYEGPFGVGYLTASFNFRN